MVCFRLIHLAVGVWWPGVERAIAGCECPTVYIVGVDAILRGMDAILVDDDGWCCKGEILQTHEGYSG